MSVTEREVSFEVASEGGFPTAEEFTRVWNGLADVAELGFSPLIERIAGPLVEAYESMAVTRVTWSFHDIGLLSAYADLLVSQSEHVLENAKKLQVLCRHAGEAVWNDGQVDATPPFSERGTDYEFSASAFTVGERQEIERINNVLAGVEDALTRRDGGDA